MGFLIAIAGNDIYGFPNMRCEVILKNEKKWVEGEGDDTRLRA